MVMFMQSNKDHAKENLLQQSGADSPDGVEQLLDLQQEHTQAFCIHVSTWFGVAHNPFHKSMYRVPSGTAPAWPGRARPDPCQGGSCRSAKC